MIPKSIIEALIATGSAGIPTIPASPKVLSDKDRAWSAIMCGNDPWLRWANRLSRPQLENLIRGLVLYGKAIGFNGGSVSPVIVLYRAFVDIYPLEEPELTHWIADNRKNEYEPFGTFKHGNARSLEEFRDFERWSERDHQERLTEEASRQERAHAAKLSREAIAATGNLRNAVRRGDSAAVLVLLDKGADWKQVVNESGSLVALAEEYDRTSMAKVLTEHGIS
jgi:hypothetical protein